MPLHDCRLCKSAFSTKAELHRHMEEIHHTIFTWKCEFCYYEAEKIGALKRHYRRFEKKPASDTRSCNLSEATPSYLRRCERLVRKRGTPDTIPTTKSTADPPTQTSTCMPNLPKIPKLTLTIPDDTLSLHAETDAEPDQDPHATPETLEDESLPPTQEIIPSPQLPPSPEPERSTSSVPGDVRIIQTTDSTTEDDIIQITVKQGSNKYGTLKLKSVTVVTEKFYHVYGIERRGEIETRTAYFDNE